MYFSKCCIIQYTTELQCTDRAQQFVGTVASSNQVFNGRPMNNPTIEDLLKYILCEEIKTTCVSGSYSGKYRYCTCYRAWLADSSYCREYTWTIIDVNTGFLQIQFVSTAVKLPIQQHCEMEWDMYDILLLPQFVDSSTYMQKEPTPHYVGMHSTIQ